MRSTALTALLLAACGFAFAKDAPAPFESIGVFVGFENPPSAVTTEAMQAEVDRIMSPLGLSFLWQQLGPARAPSFADLIVIRFIGSCEGIPEPFSELGPNGSNDTTLAATKTSSNGEVLHFTEVHCDAMRHYLASDVAALDEHARDTAYGRALGRILAHEMYHVFADTPMHGNAGIARAGYSRQDLLQPVFVFEPKEAQILREYASRALHREGD